MARQLAFCVMAAGIFYLSLQPYLIAVSGFHWWQAVGIPSWLFNVALYGAVWWNWDSTWGNG